MIPSLPFKLHRSVMRQIIYLAVLTSSPTFARDAEKCYPSNVDPSLNRNNNKPGTACHAQVRKVRKLEFDPQFDCSKAIRQQWEQEIAIAEKMKCKT